MTATQQIFGSFKSQVANARLTNVGKDDMFKIPLDKIHEEEGFNCRDYSDPEVEAQIEAFAQAFEAGRWVPPIVVRIDPSTGEFLLVEGHQRVRGAKRARDRGAKIDRMTCVAFRGNNIDRHYVKHTSQNGLKFKPVAIARDYLGLINMGQTVQEIAKGVHQKVAHVEGMLLLAEATPDVHAMVNNGTVSATTAIDLVRKHGEKTGEFLAKKLVEEKAKGKTKIRPAAVQEDWVPPRKLASAIFTSLAPVYESLASQPAVQELLAKPEALSDSSLDGQTVTVDLKSLLQLCQAFKNAEALKHKREGKSAEDPAAKQDPAADTSEAQTA